MCIPGRDHMLHDLCLPIFAKHREHHPGDVGQLLVYLALSLLESSERVGGMGRMQGEDRI